MEAEEIERRTQEIIDSMMLEGIKDDVQDLSCPQYMDGQIESDNLAAQDYDTAI